MPWCFLDEERDTSIEYLWAECDNLLILDITLTLCSLSPPELGVDGINFNTKIKLTWIMTPRMLCMHIVKMANGHSSAGNQTFFHHVKRNERAHGWLDGIVGFDCFILYLWAWGPTCCKSWAISNRVLSLNGEQKGWREALEVLKARFEFRRVVVHFLEVVRVEVPVDVANGPPDSGKQEPT